MASRIIKTVHFEAVQVVSKLEDGRLREWWPGDKVASLREARANAVRLRKECPTQEFEVIRVEVSQMPLGYVRKGTAAAAPPPVVGW